MIDLKDKTKLFIYGQSNDVIQFAGCLVDSIGVDVDSHFRITAGDFVVQYAWNDKGGWFAGVIKEPKPESQVIVAYTDPLGLSADFDDAVPIVTIPAAVDVVMIEEISIFGKITGVEFLVNKAVELTEYQRKVVDSMSMFITKNGQPLINISTESDIIGWVYFNIKDL